LGSVFLLAAGVSLAKKADKKPYTPWTEPATGIEWRGDQRHPARLDQIAGENERIVRVDSFRWSFTEQEKSWDVDFGQAWLDTSGVTDISLIWYPFFPKRIAGHTSLLLHTKPGALKRIQGGKLVPSQATGVVFSLEARMRKGQKYGFKDGVTGKFGVVYSISTWENYIQRCIDVKHGAIHRWKLSISPEETQEYAAAIMDHTLLDHSQETYWLTRNSCSTAVVDMLIKGIKRFQQVSQTRFRQEALLGLQRANDLVFHAGLGEDEAVPVQEEGGRLRRIGRWVWKHTKKAVRLEHVKDFLGLSKDKIKRRFLGGLLVNPYMSFPAKIALVLEHRGLIVDHKKPNEIIEYKKR
jgi:hypothetical protein